MLAAIRCVRRSFRMRLVPPLAFACCLTLHPTLAHATSAGEPLQQISTAATE